jgi:tetratricopeptide (TPR) repeat protein
MNPEVRVWEEKVIIPTYGIGKPDKNPMFLEKRVYQGSSGVVYPHPIVEKIEDTKTGKEYNAVFLENKYLKLMILPELGGRIQMAWDKVKERHFIYYNRVIKPALVGLTGPWISGGIEFNWPQHHRPSTFEPVDHSLAENPDGSKTVFVNEVERMFHTKALLGFTLYPDKAYMEIKANLYNRTPFPQTFLWWANPAVRVNDHYQSIFPPDVHAVFDHGRRDVSSFPIAKGTYYKVNYAPGTDISRYKNIPVPTSFMAVASKYDFIGGYEHDTRGGVLHVADHHVSPGKKQWTWGYGEFGQAWDKNLTDEDGPYIELMTGVYTDNQPDFSWLQPYEEKSFVQYFMPYGEAGAVKNATKEALVNLEISDGIADIRVCSTQVYNEVKISLTIDGKEEFSETVRLSPDQPCLRQITLKESPADGKAGIQVIDLISGLTLVSYYTEIQQEEAIPSPAEAIGLPAGIESNELLFLAGQHLEQYRHATYRAEDYYREALRRDEGDIRNNNALGLLFLRKGKFEEAEPFFRKAIRRMTQRNPNPYEGEAYFNLGWSLKMQGRNEEACDAFYKAVWNDAWQHSGYFELARLATGQGRTAEALELIEKSLIKNTRSHTARHLRAVLLRKTGQTTSAHQYINDSLTVDPFNFGCLFEKRLLFLAENKAEEAEKALKNLKVLSRQWVHNLIGYAFDYAHAGLYKEASSLLGILNSEGETRYPMIFYYLGWFAFQSGEVASAIESFKLAASLAADYCFPNRVEDVLVLQKAMELNEGDSKAPYYLGNFFYDKRQYSDAITLWEKSVRLDPSFPTVHRNLALAYFNKRNDTAGALNSLTIAFTLDSSDGRVLMELDQLHRKLNKPPAERLKMLEERILLFEARDDLYLERVTLYNQLQNFEKAKQLLEQHHFHPWEGGEGKAVGQYLLCHLELARLALSKGQSEKALELLDAAGNYPGNLGEGKLSGARENDIFYLKGLACEQAGRQQEALSWFIKATEGNPDPVQAVFYNDPQPDKIFYQGLAWRKLSQPGKAEEIFYKLLRFGEAHRNDTISIDYFAVSLPDMLVFDTDLDLRNRIHCLYLIGLGCLGLGGDSLDKAESCFNRVLALDINHQGAMTHKQMIS